LADLAQAVLKSVERIADLMGKSGNQLSDAEHFLVLPDLGLDLLDISETEVVR